MPALQVKDCPIEVYERLRECAAQENRSISQQTVTILEEYLALRPASKNSVSTEASTQFISGHLREYPHYSEDLHDETDYLGQFRKVMEEISELPPIPISERCPRADVILAQIREEEAR
ncbi:MAG: hypothetical protein Q4C36_02245 [Coriobacteriia bacterium]|nr:hypothetical protein [Coriobacteriia bacterium]